MGGPSGGISKVFQKLLNTSHKQSSQFLTSILLRAIRTPALFLTRFNEVPTAEALNQANGLM